MPFVRRKAGVVTGAFAAPQPGRAEEFMADDHPEVIAYRDKPISVAPLTAEELYDMLKAKNVLRDEDRPRGRDS